MNEALLPSVCLLGIAAVFLVQKPIEIRVDILPLELRRLLGYALSLLLPLLLTTYAVARRPRSEVLARRDWLGAERWAIASLASAGVLLTAGSEWTTGYVLAFPEALPHSWAAAMVLTWLVLLGRLLGREHPTAAWVWAMLAVSVAFRVVGMFIVDVPSGDMLPTVDMALDHLLTGGQPYRVYPPAMPYFPLTLATYVPAKLLGLDLRWANVVVEALVPVVAFWPRRKEPPSVTTLALPAMFLLPSWTVYGLDTTFAATLLAVAALGQAVWSWTGRAQALALGAAVATNQTLVLIAPFIALFWLRERGVGPTVRLIGLATAVTTVAVLPFLLWEPVNFVAATFGIAPFESVRFVGRFSLRPLFDGVAPWAATAGILVVIGTALVIASRLRDRRAILPVAGVAYCVCLLLLHRTFSHYFLPVLTMVLAFSPRPVATASAPFRTSYVSAAVLPSAVATRAR